MGKQHVGAAVNLVAYYLLALPTGIWLAFLLFSCSAFPC